MNNNDYGNLLKEKIKYVDDKELFYLVEKLIEEREYFLTYDISSIKDKEKWKTVKAIAYTRVTRTLQDETFITDNYYIM